MAGVYGNTVLREGFFNKKKKEDKKSEKRINMAINAIKSLIDYFDSDKNNSSNVYFDREYIFNMGMKEYKIPEKKYIDHIIKTHNKYSLVNYYGNDMSIYNKLFKKHISSIPELGNPKENNLIMVIDHDEYWLCIGEKSKKIFEIDGEKVTIYSSLQNALKKFDEFYYDYFSEEELIKADAKLGYYRLSNCPDGDKKINFPIK